MLPFEQEYVPLYCSLFYIEDQTLCFNGLADGPFQFFMSEKCAIVLKHVFNGDVKLPDKEKMNESLN